MLSKTHLNAVVSCLSEKVVNSQEEESSGITDTVTTTVSDIKKQSPRDSSQTTSEGLATSDSHCCGQESLATDSFISKSQTDVTPLRRGRLGRLYNLTSPLKDYQLFYIGYQGQTMTNLIMNYTQNQVGYFAYLIYHTLLVVCLSQSSSAVTIL